MLAELFGVPQEDRHMLFQWSNVIIGCDDPDISISSEHVNQAFMDLAVYAMGLYAARKENPGDDLITMLVNTQVGGEPMSIADYLSAFILLVVAGNETTRNSISGGTLALSQFPAERQKLVDDPSLIGGAVDEIIRWVHPVIYMRRTALEDYTLRGVTIKKGDKLALWYMSGNRDEEKWSDPFTFNVTRNGPRHLSFGYGQHLCIGWRLAEIQLTVLLEEMLARFPDIEVIGGITKMRTNFLNSIKTMQVRSRVATGRLTRHGCSANPSRPTDSLSTRCYCSPPARIRPRRWATIAALLRQSDRFQQIKDGSVSTAPCMPRSRSRRHASSRRLRHRRQSGPGAPVVFPATAAMPRSSIWQRFCRAARAAKVCAPCLR